MCLCTDDTRLAKASNLSDLTDKAQARNEIAVATYVASRTALKALDTTKDTVAVLTGAQGGRAGLFVWRAGNFSAQVAADTQEGVYVKADAIASSAGAWVREYTGPVNVRWFGAVGDGTTDNSAAFNAAAAMSGAVYAPAGTYALSSRMDFACKAVNFRGDGKGLTVLKFAGTTAGVRVDNGLAFAPVDIRDMSIQTTATTPTGIAIEIIWPETYDGRMIHKGTISDVQIEGANNQTMGWATGISYLQACFVTIENCGILGKHGAMDGAQVANTQSQVGVKFFGGVYPVDIRINNCFINCFYYGVHASGAPEGIAVSNSTFLNCRTGVWYVPTTFSAGIGGGSAAYRPLLCVSDSHFAVFEHGIYTNGVVQSFIHDNLFYGNGPSLQNITLCSISNGGGWSVHNNQFYTFNTTYSTIGVFFNQIASGNVLGNIFGSMLRGVWFGSTCGAGVLCQQANNIFDGTFTNAFLDSRP